MNSRQAAALVRPSASIRPRTSGGGIMLSRFERSVSVPQMVHANISMSVMSPGSMRIASSFLSCVRLKAV